MKEAKLTAKPKQRRSAPDYVIDQIKNGLIERRIKPGDKLPSETELEELYGVSRGSVRQAMKSLEMLGVISIRPGDGSYVNDGISKNSLNPLAFSLLLIAPSAGEFSNARLLLELNILNLVLDNQSAMEDVVAKLTDNIERQRELISIDADISEMVENDKNFHRILSAACNNQIMQTIYDYVLDSFSTKMALTTSIQSKSSVCATTVDHHTEILNALKSKEPEKVKEAVERSMNGWGALIEDQE